MADASIVKQIALIKLFEDFWSEDLTDSRVFYDVWGRILSPREKLIVEYKVDGKNDNEICTALNMRISSLRKRIAEIKRIYTIDFRERVDDSLRVENLKMSTGRKSRGKLR